MALTDAPDAKEITREARQPNPGTSTLARIARYTLVRAIGMILTILASLLLIIYIANLGGYLDTIQKGLIDQTIALCGNQLSILDGSRTVTQVEDLQYELGTVRRAGVGHNDSTPIWDHRGAWHNLFQCHPGRGWSLVWWVGGLADPAYFRD